MMTPRHFRIALVVCAGLASLLFTYRLTSEMFNYLSLRACAPARVLRWEVEEEDGRFALRGIYAFETQMRSYGGSSRLSGPYYLNEPSAVSALKERAKEPATAWYNPNNPSFSALERLLPTGLLLRAAICYGVLVYFITSKKIRN